VPPWYLSQVPASVAAYVSPDFGILAKQAHHRREDLLRLHRDGAKSIALRIKSWDQKGQFERLANKVLPRLK